MPFLNFDRWWGVNTQIESEKKPIYVVEEQVNYELARKQGSLVRRKPYTNILTAGLTALKNLFEFKDQNGTRQVLIQDGTGLEESVYSGGAYAAITAITNDQRSGTPTVDQMYPVVYENNVRSGAGLNASTDVPFWYGYLSARNRYNDQVTIAAGKYLEDQIRAISGLLNYLLAGSAQKSNSSTTDLSAGNYAVLYAPVVDGQTMIPGITFTKVIHIASGESISYVLAITAAKESAIPRCTALDLFIATMGDVDGRNQILKEDAYFLERIDLNDDGPEIVQLTGTFEVASPPTYIDSDDDRSAWESFDSTNFLCDLEGASNSYTRVRITAVADNGAGKTRFTINQVFVAGDSGDAVTITIYSGWYEDTDHKRAIMYDNKYRILGAAMPTYLNVPAGDLGISDFRYKYSAVNGHRMLILGVTDHVGGNYSIPYDLDVIPALNVVRTPTEPVGCCPFGENFLMFLEPPGNSSHLSIFGNQDTRQIDNFIPATITNQKAVVNVGQNTVFGFDYEGPWMLIEGRPLDRIGESLFEWWDETLSAAIKDTCTVSYNHLKKWVIFSFPDYTTSPYTNGIGFVFDLKAYNELNGKVFPWFYFTTNKPIKSFCLATDKHLLTSNGTSIVDWNQNNSTDESIEAWIKLKVIKNRLAGKNRMHYDTLWLEYTGTISALTLYPDGGAGVDVTSQLTGNEKLFIKRFLEEFQLKLQQASGYSEVKITTLQLLYSERNY